MVSTADVKKEKESIPHLFMECSTDKKALEKINSISSSFPPSSLSYKEILLGEVYGLPTIVWNMVRAQYLWEVWLSKNEILFNGKEKDIIHPLMIELVLQVEELITSTKKKLLNMEHKRKCHTYSENKMKQAHLEEESRDMEEILMILY